MSLLLPDNSCSEVDPVGFSFAAVRYGPELSAEHEWLRLDRDHAAGFEQRDAQMRVLPGRCTAIASETSIEVVLMVASEGTDGVVMIRHALAGDSVIEVENSLLEPVAVAEPGSGDAAIELPIRAGAPLRIVAKLERGSRIQVSTRAA